MACYVVDALPEPDRDIRRVEPAPTNKAIVSGGKLTTYLTSLDLSAYFDFHLDGGR